MTTSTTSLRAVTLQTVANYRHAAERTLRAYRSGGQRLIAVVRGGVDQAAQRGAEPYVPALAAALRRAGDNLGSMAHQSLDAVSERTSRAITIGADGVSSRVRRVADLAEGVDNKVVATGLQAAVRVSLPGAKVALALSERVASGADKLAEVAAGAQAKGAAKVAGKRVRKAEATDVAAAGVADIQAEVKTAVRRTQARAAQAADAATLAVAKPAKAVQARVKKVAAKPQVKKAVAAATRPARRTRAKAAAVVRAAQDAAATVAAA